MPLVFTVVIAFLGAYCGLRLRLPAGALVGSMIAVAIFNIVCGLAYMPQGVKFYTQIATGAYVGAKITCKDTRNLRYVIKPALILSAVMLVFTLGTAVLICRISNLSISTALFAMAPAGITDMTLASADFPHSEPSVVALIQTLRVFFTILVLPPVIRRCTKSSLLYSEKAVDFPLLSPSKSLRELGTTMIVALISGALGKGIGIPGGAIAFPMAGCAIYNIRTTHGYMPLRLRQFIQTFAGALIGTTVGRKQAMQMLELWDVVLLAIVSFIVLDIIAGILVYKWTDMDLITAFFACAPGGLTDMTLIAADMGADGVKVAGMHMVRLVSVVALYPSIIQLLITHT